MKNHRASILSAAVVAVAAFAASGCFLTSGQILLKFNLQNPIQIASVAPVVGQYVDLNTLSDYRDHKDKVKDLADIALLGTFVNTGDTPIHCQVWMVDGNPGSLTALEVQAQGVRVWGPFDLPTNATHDATRKIGWDESAALFGAGKSALLQQVKGDGQFSLYLISAQSGGVPAVYTFEVHDAGLALVIGAGI